MAYALIYDGKVFQVSDITYDVSPEFRWLEFDENSQKVEAGWENEGDHLNKPATAGLIDGKNATWLAVKKVLDDRAKEYGFDSISEAMTWIGDKNLTKSDLASQLRDWRSDVYDLTISYVANYIEGDLFDKKIEALLFSLPPAP